MKRKLRIAMVFSSDPSKAGGVQEHVLFLSEALRKRGHDVDVIGPQGNIFPYKHYTQIGQIIQLPLPNGNWGNVVVPTDGSFRLRERLSKKQYDLMHIHEPYIPFLSWEAIWKMPMPKVTTFHTAWNDHSSLAMIDYLLPFFREPFSAHMHGAIYISNIVRKRWHSLTDRRVKERVIGHGIDGSFVPVKKVRRGMSVNILFVARLVARKGLHYLLEAMVQLQKECSTITLTIVGEGQQRAILEKFVSDYGLADTVHFVGAVMGEGKIRYYQDADIFCAPYADEGFGLTILEAMACGLPIVGFRNEAFAETLRGYPAPQLLVAHKDVGGLAGALWTVIQDRALRERLGAWGVAQAEKFNWESVAQETEAMYYDVL